MPDIGGIVRDGTVIHSVGKVGLVPLHWSLVGRRIGCHGGWREVVPLLSLIVQQLLLLSSLLFCGSEVGCFTGEVCDGGSWW